MRGVCRAGCRSRRVLPDDRRRFLPQRTRRRHRVRRVVFLRPFKKNFSIFFPFEVYDGFPTPERLESTRNWNVPTCTLLFAIFTQWFSSVATCSNAYLIVPTFTNMFQRALYCSLHLHNWSISVATCSNAHSNVPTFTNMFQRVLYCSLHLRNDSDGQEHVPICTDMFRSVQICFGKLCLFLEM